MERVTVEDRGRILIPKEIRDELGIRPREKFRIEARDGEVVLKPEKDLEAVRELKGCVKDGGIDPIELKKIWEM